MSANPSPRATGSDSVSGPSASSSSSPASSSSASSLSPASTSIKHRPAWIAFVVLGAIFCLGMGFWQLARYQASTGTVQNLGYTFMWPFMAGFLIYAYAKYVRLEADETDRVADQDGSASPGVTAGSGHDDDNDDTAPHSPAPGSRAGSAGRARRRAPVVTEIPADLLPTRRPTADTEATDEGLAAYNSYLADLARKDHSGDRSQEKPAS